MIFLCHKIREPPDWNQVKIIDRKTTHSATMRTNAIKFLLIDNPSWKQQITRLTVFSLGCISYIYPHNSLIQWKATKRRSFEHASFINPLHIGSGQGGWNIPWRKGMICDDCTVGDKSSPLTFHLAEQISKVFVLQGGISVANFCPRLYIDAQ